MADDGRLPVPAPTASSLSTHWATVAALMLWSSEAPAVAVAAKTKATCRAAPPTAVVAEAELVAAALSASPAALVPAGVDGNKVRPRHPRWHQKRRR